ncbi:IspD/TarI family cytidylyltransferase [Bifidobacterium jacchi]|uniref:IspD/TarI family cytidylyltransferase n=1 Tax=Bifidobacterium jacchi TaxID=2490545 RepID=UPI003BAD0DDC
MREQESNEPVQPNAAETPRQTAASMPTPVVAVVLAAGFGTRFDPANPKQLVSIASKPIVCWSIEAFESCDAVTDILVVVNPQVRGEVERLVDEAGYPKVRMIIDGGSERVDSTACALQALADAGIPPHAKLLIHDAVRPFVAQSSIRGCVDALDQFDAATVACASTDTMLLTRDLGDRKVIESVPDRAAMFRAQTPQAFRFETIRHAYDLAAGDPDFHPTDDTRVVVDYMPDTPVAIVAGSETNLKITTRADLPIAERIAAQRAGGSGADGVGGGAGVDGGIGFGGEAGIGGGADVVDAAESDDDRPLTKEEVRARMHALFAQARTQTRGR